MQHLTKAHLLVQRAALPGLYILYIWSQVDLFIVDHICGQHIFSMEPNIVREADEIWFIHRRHPTNACTFTFCHSFPPPSLLSFFTHGTLYWTPLCQWQEEEWDINPDLNDPTAFIRARGGWIPGFLTYKPWELRKMTALSYLFIGYQSRDAQNKWEKL